MNWKHALAGSLCYALIMVLLVAILTIPPDPSPPWTRSIDQAPPAETPFVGFWIDHGQPIPCVVVSYGEMFYEYNPASKYPAPLFSYPPVWWVEMPGAAR
jgi:hypothetical protein